MGTDATIDARVQAALARLTDNEKECLRRRLRQQTAKEMALELSISPHAVKYQTLDVDRRLTLRGGVPHRLEAMVDPAAPILLFDSGVGGLTVLAEVRKLLPAAPVIYFADTAGLPYGEKTEAEIAARVAGLLGRLSERFAPRLITIACNTASTIALGMVREVLHVPIVGTVPAIKPAAAMTRTGVIGLLGTAATIRQGYVDKLEAEFANGHRLIRHAAPELVAAAETVLRGGRPDAAVFENAADGLRSQAGGADIDTVVLACTHFPLVAPQLQAALGEDVCLVHGAEGIARRVQFLTRGQPFRREIPDFALFTGDPDQFRTLLPELKAYGLDRAESF